MPPQSIGQNQQEAPPSSRQCAQRWWDVPGLSSSLVPGKKRTEKGEY